MRLHSNAAKASGWVAFLAALNGVLLAVILWQGKELRRAAAGEKPSAVQVAHAAEDPGEEPESHAAPDNVEPGLAQGRSDPEASGIARSEFDLRQVDAEDYEGYVANLRRLGVPEDAIREIVLGDLRKAYAPERMKLMGEYSGGRYWELPDEEAAAELAARKRELDEKIARTLQSLVGGEVPDLDPFKAWEVARLGSLIDFLPDEKRALVSEVLVKNRRLEADVEKLVAGRSPRLAEETRYQMLVDREEKNAALWEMLTPEEFAEVELRTSWTADNLRKAMAKFHPSEEEFRKIFRVWKDHDDELVLLYGTSRPDPGNEHVFAEIRSFLGEERFREYRETWWK